MTSIFTGRQKELASLTKLLQSVNQGQGKVFLISGEPGSGKSTLVREFIEQKEENYLTAIVECSDKEGLMPWQPFKSALEQLNSDYVAGITEDKVKVLDGLKEIMKDVGADWITRIPVIGKFADLALLSVKTAKSAKRHLSKQKNEPTVNQISGFKQVFELIENEIRRLASLKPVIIFLDDLQWTDNSSLNFLFSLSRSIKSNPFPILLIGSYRPHEIKQGRNIITDSGENKRIRHPFEDKLNELRNYTKKEKHVENNSWFEEMTLEAFTLDEIKELLNKKYPENNFPKSFVKQLFEQTNGHVLFLTETLDYLEENEVIYLDSDNVYKINSGKNIDFPTSVVGVISERLDRLDEKLRKIVECASVRGNDFSLQTIETILKIDELDLLDYFEDLNKKHGLLLPYKSLVVKDLLLELYRFSNSLVKKYIYDNLDAPKRRALHKRTALVIKKLYGDEIETDEKIREEYNKHLQIANGLIEPITGHLIKIENLEMNNKSEEILNSAKAELQSTKSSYEQFAMEECIEHSNRVLAFVSQIQNFDDECKEIYFEAIKFKQEALSWLGHYDEALEIADKMLNFAKETENDEFTATAVRLKGKEYRKLGMYEDSLKCYQKELEILEKDNNEKLLAQNYSNIGWILNSLARYEEGIIYHEKSLEIAKKIDSKSDIANALNRLGNSYRSISNYEKSLKYFYKSLKIYEELVDKERIAAVNNNMGLSYSTLGEYDKALEHFNKSLDIDIFLNNLVDVANDYINIGNIYMYKGNYIDSDEYYKKALKKYEEINDKLGLSQTYISLGVLYQSIGEYTKSLEYFEKSLAINTQLDNKLQIAVDYIAISSIQKSIGAYKEAIEAIEKSIAIYEDLGDDNGVALGQITLGGIYNKLEEYEIAINIMKLAIEIFEKQNVEVSAGSAYQEIGFSYEALGKYDEAYEFYYKSLKIFEKLDDLVSLSASYNYMGGLYYSKDEYDKSLEYYIKGLEIDEQLDNKMGMATSYNNIANIYKSGKEEYKKALEYYKKAIDITLETEDKLSLLLYYENIAKTYQLTQDLENVEKYFLLASDINKSMGKVENVSFNLYSIAESYMDADKFDEAIEFYQDSLAYAKKTDNYYQIGMIFNNFGYIASQQNNFEDAIKNFEDAINAYISADALDDAARNYFNISLMYSGLEDFDMTIYYMKKAIEVYEKGKNFDAVVDVFVKMAEKYAENKLVNKAIEIYTETINYCEDKNLTDYFAKLYNDRAVEYNSLNDAENALIDYHEALKINENNKNLQGQALNFKNIAEVYINNEDIEKGIFYLNKAIEVSSNMEDLSYNSNIINRLVDLYKDDNDYENAEKTLLESIKFYEKKKDFYQLSISYNDMGVLYEEANLLDKALEMYQLCLTFNESSNSDDLKAFTLKNIGAVQAKLNNYDQAISAYLESLQLYTSLERVDNIAYLNYQIAYLYYYSEKDFEKSHEYFHKAIENYKALNNSKMEANSKYYLGLNYGRLKDSKKSIYYLLEASEIYHELDEKTDVADCFFEVGKVFKNEQNIEKANNYFNKAITKYEQDNNFLAVGNVHYQIGTMYRLSKDFEPAIKSLQKATEMFFEYGEGEHARYKIAISLVELGLANAEGENMNIDEIVTNYFEKALKTFIELEQIWDIGYTYLLMAQYYRKDSSIANAISHYQKAEEFLSKTNDKYNYAVCFEGIGFAYRFNEDFQNAYDSFSKAITLWNKIGYSDYAVSLEARLEEIEGKMEENGIKINPAEPSEDNIDDKPPSHKH